MFKSLLPTVCLLLGFNVFASSPLQTVEKIDILKYMGKWYEIARYENSFQKKCGGTTAEYKLLGNSVQVINTCEKLGTTRELQIAHGTAFITDKNSNSKLKVSFVPFFQRWGWFGGKYWILEIGENYEYAVIGEPKRNFLWILSRTKRLPPETYNMLLDRIENVHHFDLGKLRMSKVIGE
jgi:apolipoprotein D and lipocalin family protein